MKTRLLIFAKAPHPGFAKTRLIPALGKEGAARLARRMLTHMLEQAGLVGGIAVELCMSPGPEDALWVGWTFSAPLLLSDQGAGGLGERLGRAGARTAARGEAMIFVGTDCPALRSDRIEEVLAGLEDHDALLIPAVDGGYVLLALRQYHPRIFADIAWSTDQVAVQTRARCEELSWSLKEWPALTDIDEPADLQHLPEGWDPA